MATLNFDPKAETFNYEVTAVEYDLLESMREAEMFRLKAQAALENWYSVCSERDELLAQLCVTSTTP